MQHILMEKRHSRVIFHGIPIGWVSTKKEKNHTFEHITFSLWAEWATGGMTNHENARRQSH